MNYTNIIKRQNRAMIIIVFVLVLAVLGVSYAVFMQVGSNTNNQVITAGVLKIEYASTNGYINGSNSTIVPKSNDKAFEEAGYNFSVKNTGTLPVTYQVYLYINYDEYEKDKAAGTIKGNIFEKLEYLKYSLNTNNNKKNKISKLASVKKYVDETLVETSKLVRKYQIYEGTLSGNQTIDNHNLRLWLDEDADLDQINRYVYLKLEVNSYVTGQNPEI